MAIFAGGSGGHLVPGMALAECVKSRHPDCRVLLFRTQRAVETKVTRRSRIETIGIDLDPPPKALSQGFHFATQCYRGLGTIRKHLAESAIEVAVGVGGYPSVPGILAAKVERVPLILLEQNVLPGRVNRLFGPLAKWVACPERETVEQFDSSRLLTRTLETGNPLRASVAQARDWRWCREPVARREELGAKDRRVLLIMGGSQGAHALNRVMVKSLLKNERYRDRLFVIHITGNADRAWVTASYRKAGWMAKVAAYDANLPLLMAAADLAVARAGGSTLSELRAIGVPSVLVPYPNHRDQHQLSNAKMLEQHGAARVIQEGFFSSESVRGILHRLFSDACLESMARGALERARTDGADRIVDLMERLLEDSS